MNGLHIETLSELYLEAFTKLTLELWADCNFEEEYNNANQLLQSDKDIVFICKDNRKTPIAFIILSLRNDYVEGTNSKPVGYIEGIYVRPAYRKRGIARKLVEAGEVWCKEKGCREIASDVELPNEDSQAFHKQLGFEEANRVVCFRKDLI